MPSTTARTTMKTKTIRSPEREFEFDLILSGFDCETFTDEIANAFSRPATETARRGSRAEFPKSASRAGRPR